MRNKLNKQITLTGSATGKPEELPANEENIIQVPAKDYVSAGAIKLPENVLIYGTSLSLPQE